jgi:hypothetical protein
MNERIKKLLSQANIYDGRESLYWCEGKNLVEFAELIVGECIQAVDNVGGYNEEFHMNAIKKHFGVEP